MAGAAILAVSGYFLLPDIAAAAQRQLTLYNTHTHERTTIVYKRNGKFLASGVREMNRFLRDWRRNEITKMDPQLFDLIWEVYQKSGSKAAIHVVSGYRSPATNNMLRRRSRGVAKYSRHTRGQAMDFFLPDVKVSKLRALGLRKQVGGVGYYPTSRTPFVHMDTGRVRHWPRMSRKQLVRVFPEGKTLHVPSDGKPLPGYSVALARYKSRQRKVKTVVVAAAPETPVTSASATPAGSPPVVRVEAKPVDRKLEKPAAEPVVIASASPFRLPPQKPYSAPAAPAEIAALPRPRPANLMVGQARLETLNGAASIPASSSRGLQTIITASTGGQMSDRDDPLAATARWSDSAYGRSPSASALSYAPTGPQAFGTGSVRGDRISRPKIRRSYQVASRAPAGPDDPYVRDAVAPLDSSVMAMPRDPLVRLTGAEFQISARLVDIRTAGHHGTFFEPQYRDGPQLAMMLTKPEIIADWQGPGTVGSNIGIYRGAGSTNVLHPTAAPYQFAEIGPSDSFLTGWNVSYFLFAIAGLLAMVIGILAISTRNARYVDG